MIDIFSKLYKISASTGKVQVWWMSVMDNAMTSHSGQLNGKIKESTTHAEAKNTGRSNETSPPEQAVLEVAAKYTQQQTNKHYRSTVEEAVDLYHNNKVPRQVKNYKNDTGQMSDQLFTTIKMNGSRACVLDGDLYSKAGKLEEVKVAHIEDAIQKLHAAGFGTFDSEVYRHGFSLQRIRAAWTKPERSEKDRLKKIEETGNDPVADAKELQLHIFDIPVKGVQATERQVLLSKLRDVVFALGLTDTIKVVSAVETFSKSQRLEFRDAAVAMGYEGLVHQELDDVIVFGIRTGTTQKDKPRYDAEAFVYGVEHCKNGDGKLLLRAADVLDKVTFKCMMKVSRRDGVDYPRKMEDMQKLIGQWITFSYEELSDSGVPGKPVGEILRKCNSKGEPQE